MGMYDVVIIKCQCGHGIEFQSKAGDCALSTYDNINTIPPEILNDINGEMRVCRKCNRIITLQLKTYLNIKIDPKPHKKGCPKLQAWDIAEARCTCSHK